MPFRGRNNSRRSGWRGGFKRGRGGRNFNDAHGNEGKMSFEKPQYRHQEQLSEEEVGISEYISKFEGYSAVIKARFSDFQVNEIDIEGNIVKLTDTSIPKEFISLPQYSYEDTKDTPSTGIPQAHWDALRNLVLGSDNVPVELDAESLSKEERKSIHDCVKRYFGQKIVASTITKDEKTILEFKKWDKTNKDDRLRWPEGIPEFLYFTVYKEMMDTMEACFKIANALRIPPMKIGYAGVKDRRAKSSQWCCIKKFDPSKLLSNIKHMRNLEVGNFKFKEERLKLGQLKGNVFRIALRNVVADDDLMMNSLCHVKEHGFINYYGMQRFGNDKEAPTYLIGIKLLQGEWKEAVNLILKVKAADDPSTGLGKVKKVYAETGNAAEAVNFFKRWHNSVEKKLLEGLARNHGKDYVNALENIPRNMRLMYIHAYQSLIWNKMASKRIQLFGFKPVEGDLIFVDNLQEEESLIEGEEGETEGETESTASDTIDEKKKSDKASVRPLAADELDKYTIYDIVLPLPGYDVTYPENLRQYYKEVIEECGLKLEMPKQKVRTYNLSGTYRKILQRAEGFDWKIMYYNDPTDNLIRSDLEELNGEEEPKSVENGKYKAVIVSFTLNPASYATMVLRELLKCNTSSSVQARMNNYGDNKPIKPKVILESTSETTDVKVENQIDEVQQGSLLADQEKYENFKNILFKDILDDADDESSTKRELEVEEDETANTKLKNDDILEDNESSAKRELEVEEDEATNKKLKTDEK